MIDSLKPYAAMKDSGVEWLGKVPAHWEVRRLRMITSIINGATPSTNRDEYWDGKILWLTPEDLGALENRRITDSARKITTEGLESCGTSLASPNSIVISTRAPIGHLGILSSSGCCNQGCRLLVPNSDTDSEYLYNVLKVVQSELWSLGQRATFTELSKTKLSNFRSPIPPLPEQAAIARFLDHVNDQIDRYISAKEKLIALLEEQKQASIHEAVTGRIDVHTGRPYAAYKPSGIEWLGDVPAHWSITRIKVEFNCLNRCRLPLSSTERGSITLREYDYYGASGVIDKVDDYLFDDDLILIAEDGANLVLRNLPLVIVARGKYWVNNHAHILRPKHGNLEYLANLLECFDYLPWISGAAQPKLTQDRLMSIVIAVPPREEQDKIASYISADTAHLRAASTRAQDEIDLLREYRTRLIADVVTGKLDVRSVAVELPAAERVTEDERGDAVSGETGFCMEEHKAQEDSR